MATFRLVVLLLALGAVLLITVQNATPALPLVFLGRQVLVLPLGVWLGGAIALGSFTTLVITLLPGGGPPARRSPRRHRYPSPQSFYESPPSQPGGDVSRVASRAAASQVAAAGEWQSWTNLRSPAHWDNWEALSQAPKPDVDPAPARSKPWFGRQPAPGNEQVEASLQELASDWGDLERRRYHAPGVSPVQDSLEEITQGWEDIEASPGSPTSPGPGEPGGSMYSYGYRDRAYAGQTDHIYAPPDQTDYAPPGDQEDWFSDDPSEYLDPDPTPSDEDGVVDADYRVLIPPPPPAPPEPDWQTGGQPG
ncbi:MAG: hypothetical protein VKL98_07435 [Cyanobacteriota bacterium]|nr:hypothetical protein [Cyanobacteriota bacterium]